MNKTVRAAAMAVVLTLGVATATAQAQTESAPPTTPADVAYDTEATLNVSQTATPPALDPVNGTSPVVDFAYMSLFYDRLIELKSDGTLAPMLAESWELDDDGLGITLALRTGVAFHDGTPFDADAVVANIERVLAADGTIAQRQLQLVSGIEKIDDATVHLTTTADATVLPFALASYIESGAIVSPAALADPSALATTPSGSGPYVLGEIGQDRITYERADEYWDEALMAQAPARIVMIAIPDDNARLNALRSGQVDVMAVGSPIPNLEQIAESDDLTITRFESTARNIFTWLHIGRPPLDDVNVRRAISMAIDRNAIAELTGNTCVASLQPFGKGFVGHDDALDAELDSHYDPQEAERLLGEAGVSDLELQLVTNQAPINNDVSVALQAMMASVGIDLVINQLPSNETASAWSAGDTYDWYQAQNNGAADPYFVLADQYLGRNSRGAPQELIDLATTAAVQPLGSEERNEAYQAVSAYLVENPTNVVICSYPLVYLSRSNIVGVDQDAQGSIQVLIDARHIAVVADS